MSMDFSIGTTFGIEDYDDAYRYAVAHGCTIGIEEDRGDREENVYVIEAVPEPTAQDRAERRIDALKAQLAGTDYQAIKFAEGELTSEEYAETRAQRAAWRAEINALQAQYGI